MEHYGKAVSSLNNLYAVLWQIIAFDELKTDYKNPIDQCNTLNPVSKYACHSLYVQCTHFHLHAVVPLPSLLCLCVCEGLKRETCVCVCCGGVDCESVSPQIIHINFALSLCTVMKNLTDFLR